MSKLFFPAPEVAAIGQELIFENHNHLIVHAVRVEFVFCSETTYKGGQAIWGTARKVSSLSSFLKRETEVNWTPGLSDEEIEAIEDDDARDCAKIEKTIARDDALEKGNAPFFVITISKPVWDALTAEHRVALVDHELMHCGASFGDDGKVKLVLIGHDFEGFNAEIERHGLWRSNAANMAAAMQNAQLTMNFGEEQSDEPEKDSLEEAVARISELADVTVTHAAILPVTPDDAPSTAPKKRGRPRKSLDDVAVAVQ